MRARATVLLCAGALFFLGARAARADFEIVLYDGGNIIVGSYELSGGKIIAYDGSGKIEIPLSRVMNIRDRGIDQTAAVEARKPPPPAKPPNWTVTAPRPVASFVTPQDARARDAELSRSIALAYRDLSFAEYRGEPKDALEKRKAEIAKLEAERSSLRKIGDAH